MSAGPLEPLAWDTNHFGIAVARLTLPGDDSAGARAALDRARRDGIGLVYWQTEPRHDVPADLLAEFAGRLVDRKATFRRDLDPATAPVFGAPPVVEFARGPASPALLSLAVAAGGHSRFRVDPLIPEDRFVALYTTWMDRSTRGELADAVLVAADGFDADPLGVVTLAREGEDASIGLIAVAEAARGRGVGRRLMDAAHWWMAGRGARRASVVTQLANVAACRLYEGGGYRLGEVTHYYHFWPAARR